jgi:hypothetical protein
MAREYDDDARENFGEEGREDRDEEIIRRAKTRIKTPAIVLLIAGMIYGVLALMNIPSLASMDAQFQEVEDKWDNDPNLKPEQKKEMKQMLADIKGPLKIYVPVAIVFGLLSSVIAIVGSLKIMNLKSRGLGVLASVISMVPIVSGCCCVGLPVGIWVLIVLGKPEVKAGFAAIARAADSADRY